MDTPARDTDPRPELSSDRSLRIDIVSDVVCPWCLIGYRQLAIALERTGTPADIHWQPFELNPDMPDEGENLAEHIVRKYGSSDVEREASRKRLSELGDSLGVRIRFHDEKRILPTFRAHSLLAWARPQGREHDLKLALLTAYFTDDRNIADPATLARIAGEIGLDAADAAKVLADGRFADAVRKDEQFWLERGIRGVPAMVFDRQHLVTGAQGVDNYEAVLRELVPPSVRPRAPH